MKKRLWNWGIIIGIITILAIGIPRIISNEAEGLSSTEEEKVEQLQGDFPKWSLRPLDKFMVQSYQAKSNGHQWNTVERKSIKNYRVTWK